MYKRQVLAIKGCRVNAGPVNGQGGQEVDAEDEDKRDADRKDIGAHRTSDFTGISSGIIPTQKIPHHIIKAH